MFLRLSFDQCFTIPRFQLCLVKGRCLCRWLGGCCWLSLFHIVDSKSHHLVGKHRQFLFINLFKLLLVKECLVVLVCQSLGFARHLLPTIYQLLFITFCLNPRISHWYFKSCRFHSCNLNLTHFQYWSFRVCRLQVARHQCECLRFSF